MQLSFETFTLANGLKVIVHPDHSIPKAVVDIVYRVGSKDEDPGRTGFAHLFEHLMFEGSKHIPHYDTPLQQVGGSNNAFTNPDITNYYLTLPANQLETAFWLESDRMLELAFSQEKLDVQRSVVIEEYKQRYLNQPYGDARHKLLALGYQSHPYRWPTIGQDIAHIEEATLDDVRDFFFGYYAPNNATLVVVGDVEIEQVRQLAEKWFGPIPSRPLKKHPLPVEPAQTAPRQQTVYADVPYPAVYKMYHVPGHTDERYYLADLLTDLLSNGKSAILYQSLLKEHQLVQSISAYSWGLHDPGPIFIDGRLAEGVSTAQYEAQLERAIGQLQSLTEESLDRIKGKLAATFVMQKTTLLNKAMGLAMYDALGDPNLINLIPDFYRRITLAEVKAAAEQYLSPDNCSTLYYLPEKMGPQMG
jgi:predicted Zn-dependent peptidase